VTCAANAPFFQIVPAIIETAQDLPWSHVAFDVFRPARNNGFTINTLSEVTETRNDFCLMLVD